MVTTRERFMVTIDEAEKIIKESSGKAEAVERLHQLKRREKAPPPPEGGIGIRQASKKYKIPHNTISYWVKHGKIPVLKRTENWLYIKEASLKAMIEAKNANN